MLFDNKNVEVDIVIFCRKQWTSIQGFMYYLRVEVDKMPYYIPVESRQVYERFRETYKDAESANIDEFIGELIDAWEEKEESQI